MPQLTNTLAEAPERVCRHAERRASPRYLSGRTGASRLLTRGGETWAVTLRDVSVDGACLILGRRFERDALLTVELPGEPDEEIKLLVRVVRAQAGDGGNWLIGCVFLDALDEDELRSLL